MNPISTLSKLIKSKPLVDQIEKDAKGMNKANWKTTVVGIISAGIALSQIWAPAQYQGKINATAVALAGVGLVAAKDHDNH